MYPCSGDLNDYKNNRVLCNKTKIETTESPIISPLTCLYFNSKNDYIQKKNEFDQKVPNVKLSAVECVSCGRSCDACDNRASGGRRTCCLEMDSEKRVLSRIRISNGEQDSL